MGITLYTMATLFKDLAKGSTLYALVKNDEMEYKEGKFVGVGMPRVEVQSNGLAVPRSVVDVTYSIDGVNYTDAVDVNAPFFSTYKLGALSLVSTDKESILKEVRETLNESETYLKDSETEIPKNRKRVVRCKELIGQLDTEFAEKQAIENRFVKLEEQSSEINALLKQILKKLEKA